jgi:hypothetical protein
MGGRGTKTGYRRTKADPPLPRGDHAKEPAADDRGLLLPSVPNGDDQKLMVTAFEQTEVVVSHTW